MAICIAFSPEELERSAELAFAGTVTTVEGDTVTLQGCVVAAEKKDTFILTKVREWPIAESDIGKFGKRYYWIEKTDKLKDHAGHTIQITARITDVEKSELEFKAGESGNGINVEIEGPGKDVVTPAANAAIATPPAGHAGKEMPITLMTFAIFTRSNLVVDPGWLQIGDAALVTVSTCGIAFAMFGRCFVNAGADIFARSVLAIASLVTMFHPDDRLVWGVGALVLAALIWCIRQHRLIAPAKPAAAAVSPAGSGPLVSAEADDLVAQAKRDL